MKRFVSILMLLVLLVLGLWVGLAYWFGMKAEQQYHALLQQASESQYAKFVNESYSRGFFQSQAKTILEVQLPSGTAGEVQNYKIPLLQDITHGPFPLAKLGDSQRPWQPVMAIIETRLEPGSALQTQFAEWWSQVPELATVRDYTVVYLDGKGEERFAIPAFQRTVGKEEPVAITWKGLSLQADFTADLKTLSGSFRMPGSEARGRDQALRLGEVKLDFAAKEGVSGLWLGDASFSLASFDLTYDEGSGPQSMLLQGLSANTSTKASGDLINSMIALRTELLKLDDTHYGPGAFEIEFRNLDAPSLTKLQESLREEQAQPGQQSGKAAELKTLSRYMEVLPGLLKKSPEIEISQCNLKTSLGDFTGKARITFDGTKAGTVLNLLTLPTALTANAEVKIGEGLLRSVLIGMLEDDVVAEWEDSEEEAPNEEEIRDLVAARVEEQLADLTARNLLLKEGETYASSLRYEGGQIMLNGRALSLQDLVQ